MEAAETASAAKTNFENPCISIYPFQLEKFLASKLEPNGLDAHAGLIDDSPVASPSALSSVLVLPAHPYQISIDLSIQANEPP